MIERFGERRKIDVPAAFGMPSGHAGLECPQCGCRHLPAVRSRRVKDRMVRTRACRACGHQVTTSEKIVSNGPGGTP